MTAISKAWEDFWFAPTPAATLAFVRVAYGLMLLAWTATMASDLLTFYSDGSRSLTPKALTKASWSVFQWASSDLAIWIGWGVLMLAAVAIIMGYRPTPALIIAFVLATSFQHRNPYVVNSGDFMVRNLAFFLALCPSSAAFSVDRWRRYGRERFWDLPPVPQWGLRLVQIQLALVYFFSFWNKNGATWRAGTAVSQAWRIGDLQRFVVPHVFTSSLWISALLSWGTLAVELAMALLVWNRRWRRWCLLGVLLLHVIIDLTMLVGFFSWVMLAGLIAFVPPEVGARWLERIHRRQDPPMVSSAQVQESLDLT